MHGRPLPHDGVMVGVDALCGAIIKGKWKLIKIMLQGEIELFDLATDNVVEQNPEVVRDLQSRPIAYVERQRTSEWMKAQPAVLAAHGKTPFDRGFDIDDGGLRT